MFLENNLLLIKTSEQPFKWSGSPWQGRHGDFVYMYVCMYVVYVCTYELHNYIDTCLHT